MNKNSNMGMIQKAAQAQASPENQLTNLIQTMKPEIEKALPSFLTPERFTRMVLTAVRTTPRLAQCSAVSFLAAMMTAAQLGLEPNTPLGQAYLIPYSNKGNLEVQFQLGYKGLIDLAYRSGEVVSIQAHCVYENDDFEFEYGLTPKLRHKPASGQKGNLIGCYAVFHTKSGGYSFEYMNLSELNYHANRYSKAYQKGYSPWQNNFEEMAKKTVIKRVLRYAPLKADFTRAVMMDGGIRNELSPEMSEIPDDCIETSAEVTDS